MFLMKRLMSKNVPDLKTVVHPLNKGPDFSFLDGRKPAITTTMELERRKKQVELGRQIVHYLNEIKIAEQLYEEQQMQKTFYKEKIEHIKPKEKGIENIF